MDQGSSTGAPAIQREIDDLKARLVREAYTAVGMIESACEALFRLDEAAAKAVMVRDDEVDAEEVHIEEETFRILALLQPYARDFRRLTAILRVNSDLERVADHATSLAKQTIKLKNLGVLRFPTALTELGQRVPMMCHGLLTAMKGENVEAARGVILQDLMIDALDKRLFDESVDAMDLGGGSRAARAAGLLFYRCGRELERVGDLMGNIAEDVIYIVEGGIVRHAEKKRIKREARNQAGGGGQPGGPGPSNR